VDGGGARPPPRLLRVQGWPGRGRREATGRVLGATKYILGRLKEDRILKNMVVEASNVAEEVDIG
jgi:hypothetical protein